MSEGPREAPAGYRCELLPDGVRLVAAEGASPRAVVVVLGAALGLTRLPGQLRALAAGIVSLPLLMMVALSVVLGYLAVAIFINRISYELRAGTLRYRAGPLPIPGAPDQDIPGVLGLSLRDIRPSRRKPGPPWIQLRAVSAAGAEVPVGRDFPSSSRAQAEAILAILEAARTRTPAGG